MADILLPKNGLVLVCDGARALMLKNEGTAEDLKLKSVEVFSEPHAPNREMGDDRPGRVYSSVGGARSATEETDWHDQAEADFLKKIAAELDQLVAAEGVSHLVVAAPPKAMGLLRELLAEKTQAVIVAEVTKDLTKIPVAEIAGHLG